MILNFRSCLWYSLKAWYSSVCVLVLEGAGMFRMLVWRYFRCFGASRVWKAWWFFFISDILIILVVRSSLLMFLHVHDGWSRVKLFACLMWFRIRVAVDFRFLNTVRVWLNINLCRYFGIFVDDMICLVKVVSCDLRYVLYGIFMVSWFRGGIQLYLLRRKYLIHPRRFSLSLYDGIFFTYDEKYDELFWVKFFEETFGA